MNLKGGVAYIDMKGCVIDNNITPDNAIYVEGLYNSFFKALKSNKMIVLYNCGGGVANVPLLAQAYNMNSSGIIALRFSYINNNNTLGFKTIFVQPNDKYYINT